MYHDVDENSPPSVLEEVEKAADEAARAEDLRETVRLLTHLVVATKRNNAEYLWKRSAAYLRMDGRSVIAAVS